MELQQLRHCLAVVARCAAVELAVAMPTLFTPGLRRLLWGALSAWSQDASPEAKPGTYRADVSTTACRCTILLQSEGAPGSNALVSIYVQSDIIQRYKGNHEVCRRI